ncbi:molybdopterin-dependent oxidoreductase [Nocardioides aequoreus]|uniref:molybdopterin-dependent oxidoreductase n=1 Tax=Nocardioides aequoreus TaxID=397278 RepID=UPI000AE7C1D8|nr:molybdopterin-dependent oxidoreductase [Nocardioides aequoreus]
MIPREGSFTSPLRHERLTARVGSWLGVCFTICFATGLVSHWYYLDLPVVPPTRPVQGYRVTQGLHVLTGIAAIPLLLVKLWSVYPRLFAAVPWRDARALVGHGLERLSVLVLVAASIFQLVVGLANAAQWYPWAFGFRAAHYAGAWVAIGALLVHVAVKLPVIRRAYAAPLDDERSDAPDRDGPRRRTVLRAALLASAVAVVANAGQTVPWLRRVSVLAVRTGEGPQGIPINRSALAAGVTDTATDAGWRLTLVGPDGEESLTREDLLGLEQHTHELPIACVEGWSASGEWSGVRLADLLDRVGLPADADVLLTSLQTRGAFGSSRLPASFARDDLTLLALRLGGEDLDLDHGYPCRLIAPNRPGVMQTKWLTRVEPAEDVAT